MSNIVTAIFTAIGMLLVAGAAHAGEPERFRLQIKARPGETYRDVVFINTGKSVPKVGYDSRSSSKLTIRTDVDAVNARGRMTFIQKVLDFRIVYNEPGMERIVDSTDSGHLETLLQDKEMGPIVREIQQKMNIPVKTEMEPTGSVRRFDTESVSAATVLEKSMTSGVILLPEKSVAINESWQSRSVSIEPSMLGRSENLLTMTLRRIGNLDGEQVAYIDVKGSLLSFKPDDMLGAVVVEMKESESSGLVVLALARGRIISCSHRGSTVYNVVEKGEGMILRYSYEMVTKEAK